MKIGRNSLQSDLIVADCIIEAEDIDNEIKEEKIHAVGNYELAKLLLVVGGINYELQISRRIFFSN